MGGVSVACSGMSAAYSWVVLSGGADKISKVSASHFCP